MFKSLLCAVCLLTALAWGQFLPTRTGELEDRLGGFRFQWHDAKGVLLAMRGLECYLVDVPENSQLEKLLNSPRHRQLLERQVIKAIESREGLSQTTMDSVHAQYDDMLLRALCFRASLYRLELEEVL